MNCIQRLDEKNLRGLKKYVNFSTVGAAFDHTVHHVHHSLDHKTRVCRTRKLVNRGARVVIREAH